MLIRHLLPLCLLPLLAAGCTTEIAGPAEIAPLQRAQAQEEIWQKEQAIYSARGRGSLAPYIAATAQDYRAWPPGFPVPTDADDLRNGQEAMTALNNEVLEMTFISFALEGDAAVIYYRTHRTVRPDGQAVDEHFEVTHSWVRKDGEWRILGGMARPATP